MTVREVLLCTKRWGSSAWCKAELRLPTRVFPEIDTLVFNTLIVQAAKRSLLFRFGGRVQVPGAEHPLPHLPCSVPHNPHTPWLEREHVGPDHEATWTCNAPQQRCSYPVRQPPVTLGPHAPPPTPSVMLCTTSPLPRRSRGHFGSPSRPDARLRVRVEQQGRTDAWQRDMHVVGGYPAAVAQQLPLRRCHAAGDVLHRVAAPAEQTLDPSKGGTRRIVRVAQHAKIDPPPPPKWDWARSRPGEHRGAAFGLPRYDWSRSAPRRHIRRKRRPAGGGAVPIARQHRWGSVVRQENRRPSRMEGKWKAKVKRAIPDAAPVDD